MSVQTNHYYSIDLDRGPVWDVLRAPIYVLNARADVFRLTITTAGVAEDLTDASCKAWFIRADGVTVPIDGSISGSKATVALPANCYAVQGRFELSIDLISGSITHTVLHVSGTLMRTRTDSLTSGGSGVQSFDELLAAVGATQKNDRKANLLDNSNFVEPVNQRGASTYTGAKAYTVDRWFLTGSNSKLNVKSGYVQVQTTSTSYATMAQRVGNAAKLAGKTLTMAARVYSNVVPRIYAAVDVNGTLTQINNGAMGTAASYNELAFSFTVPADITEGKLVMMIQARAAAANDYTNVYWAALYEGNYTADTVPAYVPKGYAAELLECQRYFYALPSDWNASYLAFSVSGAAVARATVPTPVVMRTKPSITVEEPTEMRFFTQGKTYNSTALAVDTLISNAVGLTLSVSETMATPNVGALRLNTPTCLSADL